MLLDNIKQPKLYYGSEYIEIPNAENSLTIDETPTSEPPFKAEMVSLTFNVTAPMHLNKYLLSKVNSDWNVTTKRLPRKKKKMLKKVLNRITGIKSKKIYLHFAYRSERA
jgi:argininosuccinate synthase